MRSSGFTNKLGYSHPATPSKHARRNRSRNILWFNPPYSINVRSNVGKHFLRLLDKHIPEKHVLRSVFHRNNCKVSYSCMDNMETIVKQHNDRILKPTDANNNSYCNCRKKVHCPLTGACLTPSIVYQATVTPRNRIPRIYIGIKEHDFKTRYRNHILSFNNRRYSDSSTLSMFVWELKESNTEFSIEWSILKYANPYKSGRKTCNLCLAEKICILNVDKNLLLNKRSELLTKCRHENKFYAFNVNLR